MNDDFNEEELGLESFEDGTKDAERLIRDISGDIEDVMDGTVKDMEHADAYWKILDKTDLLGEVSSFFALQDAVELLNEKSIDEINEFIRSFDTFYAGYKKFKGGA